MASHYQIYQPIHLSSGYTSLIHISRLSVHFSFFQFSLVHPSFIPSIVRYTHFPQADLSDVIDSGKDGSLDGFELDSDLVHQFFRVHFSRDGVLVFVAHLRVFLGVGEAS